MARRRTRRRGGSACVLGANKAHQAALKKCSQAMGVASKYLSAAKATSPIAKSYSAPKRASLKGRWNPSAKAAGRRRRKRTKRRRSRSRGRKSRRRRRRSRRR
jgi:hypothetical protein